MCSHCRHRELQIIDGRVLSGDHSRKTAKFIRLQGVRLFKAVYTLMNEYGQIVGIWFCMTEGLEELRPMLQNVADRFKSYGYTLPLLYYTDVCCKDRKVMKSIFSSLDQGGVQILEQDFPLLTPEELGMKVRYIKDPELANSICDALLSDDSIKVVGFDCEWTPPALKVHADDGLVATIQIATTNKGSNRLLHNQAVVFHVARMR